MKIKKNVAIIMICAMINATQFQQLTWIYIELNVTWNSKAVWTGFVKLEVGSHILYVRSISSLLTVFGTDTVNSLPETNAKKVCFRFKNYLFVFLVRYSSLFLIQNVRRQLKCCICL